MKRSIAIVLLVASSASPFSNWEETPLMHAAAKGDIEQMRELIRSDADVNAFYAMDFPRAGYPVLRYAIDSHSLEAVCLLIEAGAQVGDMTGSPLITGNRSSNIRNLSLLSHAIRTKAPIVIIQQLLTHGAHVDGSPKVFVEWSALMVASYVGYTEAVVVLLKAGADKVAVNSMDNKIAYDYAFEQGHEEIVKLLG